MPRRMRTCSGGRVAPSVATLLRRHLGKKRLEHERRRVGYPTCVAGNTDQDPSDGRNPDCRETLTAGGYNLCFDIGAFEVQ